MIWAIGIIKFLCSAVGIFCICAFILACISSIINPNFVVDENGNKVADKYDNLRYLLAIVMSVALGIVIAL